MKKKTIEYLGYLLRKLKEKDAPKPIFLLGAGASVTGEIPLANEIAKKIVEDYSDNPEIENLGKKKHNYFELMECLLPVERSELIGEYVNNAKINVTHIYLAKMLKEGFVDYVLTVNFDNLMLRALALYNIFPPTYDMAILNDLTTSQFPEKSVVYLHGQHHGLWLLNTSAELNKVKETLPIILHTIKNNRPWIVLGYSGNDPVFDYLNELGRFDNGLYWIGYKDNQPGEKVSELLSNPNKNAYFVEGYDSDSFILTLFNELNKNERENISVPEIFDKPFSCLANMLNGIKDIEDKEPFKGAKELLEMNKKNVIEAIKKYDDKAGTDVDRLKRQIISLITKGQYSEEIIKGIEEKVKQSNDESLKVKLGEYYFNWGYKKGLEAYEKEGAEAKKLYELAIEKFNKATELNPDFAEAYNNWGFGLSGLAGLRTGQDAESLYKESLEKYKKATELNPDYADAYYNWGLGLSKLAGLKTGQEAESLYLEAIEKLKKATELNPDYADAYYNWGAVLLNLAKLKEGEEKTQILNAALEVSKKAAELGGGCYNLACVYALLNDKPNALKYLEISLENNEFPLNDIKNDEDWKEYREDKDFIALLSKYE